MNSQQHRLMDAILREWIQRPAEERTPSLAASFADLCYQQGQRLYEDEPTHQQKLLETIQPWIAEN